MDLGIGLQHRVYEFDSHLYLNTKKIVKSKDAQSQTQFRSTMASAPDCLSGGCEFESRRNCYIGKVEMCIKTHYIHISGEITVVVYSPWTREVVGSNPTPQT